MHQHFCEKRQIIQKSKLPNKTKLNKFIKLYIYILFGVFAKDTSFASPIPSEHRLQLGLQGSLIPFAPLAFVPQRQTKHYTVPGQVPNGT